MYNTEESFAVTAGLVCLCPLVVASLVVPVVGYVLLGVVIAGIAALIGTGVFLWWDTRYQPQNLPRRASQEAAARARLAQQEARGEIERQEVA